MICPAPIYISAFEGTLAVMFEDGSDRSFQAEGIPSMLIEVASGTQ
jgi:hypothetical protein